MTTERERDDARQGQTRAQGRAPQPRDPKDGVVATDTIPPEQLVTAPAGPPLLGGKQIVAVLGPYANSMMVIPEAEADQAIADKWAIEMPRPTLDANATPADPLTDQERADGTAAAKAWADAQNPQGDPAAQEQSGKQPRPPQPPQPPRRDMQAGERGPGYETKGR